MAGFIYLAAGAAVVAIWFALLFVGNPSGHGAQQTLRHALLEDADRAYFWWMAALPLICILLAWAHFSGLTQSRAPAMAILALGLAVAAASWITLDWIIASLVTLPVVFAAQGSAWRAAGRQEGE